MELSTQNHTLQLAFAVLLRPPVVRGEREDREAVVPARLERACDVVDRIDYLI